MNLLSSSLFLHLVLGAPSHLPVGGSTPPEAVKSLQSCFENCLFTAIQTKEGKSPAGREYLEVSHLRCAACDTAIVIQSTIEMKKHVTPTGKSRQHTVAYSERKWVDGSPRQQSDLHIDKGIAFPVSNTEQLKGHFGVERVVVHKASTQDRKHIWEATLIGDLLGSVDLASGISLVEMVSDHGALGFVIVNSSASPKEDATTQQYVFESESFGTAKATFVVTNGTLLPTRLALSRLGKHKIATGDILGSHNLVGNYRIFDDFTHRANGLDRYDVEYRIRYEEGVPKQLECIRTRVSANEESIDKTTLLLDALTSDEVTCSSVHDMMLPIPDGTTVHQLDSDLSKVAWEIKGGAIVKQIDSTAIEVGKAATFSPRVKLTWLIWVNIFCAGIILALFIYKGRRSVHS